MEQSFSAYKLSDVFHLQRYFQRAATSDGSATINIVGHGIASLQAVGSLVAKAQESLSGIAAAGAVGSQALKPRVATAAIATTESIGSDAIKARISSAGIVSAQGLGSDVVKSRIAASGIATSEVPGSETVKVRVASSGVPTTQVLGTNDVRARVVAAEIVSAEALGSDVAKASVASPSIEDAEAFGALGVAPEAIDGTIQCLGIESAELFGGPSVSVKQEEPAQESDRRSVAVPSLHRVRSWRESTPSAITISPRSITSDEEFGAPLAFVVQRMSVVAMVGIGSEEMQGEPGLATLLAAKAILSEERTGIPLSDIVVGTTGIVGFEALGFPSAQRHKIVVGIHRAVERVGVMSRQRYSVKSAAKIVGVHRSSLRIGIAAKRTIGVKRSPVVVGKRIPFVIKCKMTQ